MLLVQKFLLTNTFGQLEKQHGVEISVGGKFGHKFSLNYSQLDSEPTDELANQCRGLILSNGSSLFESAEQKRNKLYFDHICPGPTRIIAYGFDRFFNEGHLESKLDWKDPDLKIYDKIDGTLLFLSFDDVINEWHVSTRSTPEANVSLSFSQFTFRSLFEYVLSKSQTDFKSVTSKLDPQFTYIFEIVGPFNRIVVKYHFCRLYFLGLRNKITYKEEKPEQYFEPLSFFCHLPLTYNLSSLQDIVSLVNSRTPIEHEGVVVRDSQFNRLKIKNAAYLIYNHARDVCEKSPRGCLEMILKEQEDDILPYIPEELANEVLNMKSMLSGFIKNWEAKFDDVFSLMEKKRQTEEFAEWPERKLFALCVSEIGLWDSPCFGIFGGKYQNLKDYIFSHQKNDNWPSSFLNALLIHIGYKVDKTVDTAVSIYDSNSPGPISRR